MRGPFWKSSRQDQGPDWTLLIFHGLGKRSTFPTLAPNLNLNRNAKDHFGKVQGWVGGLTGHCWFFMARIRGAHFPFMLQTGTLTEKQKAILEKFVARSRPFWTLLIFDGPRDGKLVFHSGSQPEPPQKCGGPF